MIQNCMNAEHVQSKFAAMGARLKVREVPFISRRWLGRGTPPPDYAIDIQRDRHGEFFELRVGRSLRDQLQPLVLQAEPARRQLLLLIRPTDGKGQNDRFLCGHDEREWFVAAVPGGASSVRQAMDALQPAEVREALSRQHVSSRKRHARKNRAFRRQGEWFFVPEPGLVVDDKLILRHEPLQRGSGKPHIVEQLVRSGGEMVRVCSRYPNGLNDAEYGALLNRQPQAAHWGWRVMQRNAGVYARGTVRHADHAVITLPCWHRVLMNTETQARTMANVAFLD
jgi:hypothetical protein